MKADPRRSFVIQEGNLFRYLPLAIRQFPNSLRTVYLFAFFFWLTAGSVFAQRLPHLAYVYPAGGQVGTTFQITVGGQLLTTVSNAFVSGSGITARVLDHNRPMNQKEFNQLRDRLKELQKKYQAAQRRNPGTNVWTTADAAEREQIRAKILKNPPNRKANPAMIDTVRIQIRIAANAAPGEREIRLASPNALSNPLRFQVGTLPEFSKPVAKAANPDLERFLQRLGKHVAASGTPKYEAPVSLPVLINGQIMPGGVDRYRFTARRGQQLVIAASARSLVPYLADAVPGWFEAVLAIYDANGKELASQERFRFDPDPVMHFVVPRDGEYTVEIHDSIYRGREDFVYRLAIGELPFVTGIFPLGGEMGKTTTVALTGWNLPETSLVHRNIETGITSLPGHFFNSVPFVVNALPECRETPSNQSLKTAQKITLPIIINGRISRPGEQDYFKFEGHAGQNLVAEVFARHLNSPLDSSLRLTDASGKQLAFNDDYADKSFGLETDHADSYLATTLPKDGTYFIQLADVQGQGGPAFAYRLRISAPQPDFALRLVPSSLSLRSGVSAPVTVYALRRDGFTNAITLSLRAAPAGFSLSGARIAANQEQAKFTLKAPPQPFAVPLNLTIQGEAQIDGRRVTHPAVPAEDMMQAFIYQHLVPSREFAVMVSGPRRPFMRNVLKIISGSPARISPGGQARVRISAPPGKFADRFKLELVNAPAGISLTQVSLVRDELELVFAADAQKVKLGSTGNLICEIYPKSQRSNGKKKKTASLSRRGAFATLPAIPFMVSTE